MPKTEVRRLLKQQRSERQKEKRVEHPFAKYDADDQLMCVVCNNHVKSTWPAHLGSAFHKENMARLRALKQQKQQSQQQQQQRPVKRTSSQVQEQEPSVKRAKHVVQVQDEQVNDGDEDEEMNDSGDAGQLPADFFDNAPATHSKSSDESEEEGEEEVEEEASASSSLPPPQQQPAASQQQHQPHYQPASNLPQGFFDNAEEEARVRRAPPPIEQFENKLDEEYALFKEAMADTIVEAEKADEEDEEELWLDRDQEMFRQQAEFDSRIDKLKNLRAKTARGEFSATSEEEKMSTVRVDYDDTERELRTGLRSDARKVLKKVPPKKVATVFDDMDLSSDEDEDEEEEDEDDWRAQQL